MSWKKTLILAVLLAAIAAYIWRVELPNDEVKKNKALVFPDVTYTQLEAVRIQPKDGVGFTVKNKAPSTDPAKAEPSPVNRVFVPPSVGDTWELGEIPGSKLDPAAVSGLLTAVLELKTEDPITIANSDLSEFGLKQPELTVSVSYGGKSKELLIGKSNEYLMKRYLQVKGDSNVYLTSPGLFTAANKTHRDFRDATPLDFSDSDLAGLAIKGGDKDFHFSRLPTAQWSIDKPEAHKASAAVMGEITRELRNITAKEYIDNVALPEKLPSLLHIALEPQDKGAKSTTELTLYKLAKGDVEKAPPGLYFKISGQSPLYQTATDFSEKFLRPLDEFRERQLVTFATDLVTRVEYTLPLGKVLTAEREGEGWKVNGQEGDSVFVEQLLRDISDLTAEGFPPKDVKETFDNPFLRAVISLKSPGQESLTQRTLVIGPVAGESGARLAAIDNLSEPFIISAESFKKVFPREEVLIKVQPPSTPVSTQVPSPAVSVAG